MSMDMCSTAFNLWQDNPIIPLFLEQREEASWVQVKHSWNDLCFLTRRLAVLMWIPCFHRESRLAHHSSGCNAVPYTIHLSNWHQEFLKSVIWETKYFSLLLCIHFGKTLDCSALLWIHCIGYLGTFHLGGIMGACWTWCFVQSDRDSPII